MKRLYDEILEEHISENRQMAFLAGPRQVGKTTTAQTVGGTQNYLTWDRDPDRALIASGADSVGGSLGLLDLQGEPLRVVFDEIHKYGQWKNFLKGFFDSYEHAARIIVTGSARLNVYKRGGDSLLGRYFPFRMHPISLRETSDAGLPDSAGGRPPIRPATDALPHLLRFGGFPEPFLKASGRFHSRWTGLRAELLLREDVRDLTRIHEIGQLEVLAQLLSHMSGQLVNFTNLGQDARVSVETAQRWVKALESLFFCFTVRPWFRNVPKSLRKQPKVYLWDWSAVADPGARKENLVALHLLKATHVWQDLGLGDFALHYVRDKAKREVDFLVAHNNQPWFLVEVKSSHRRDLNPHLERFQSLTGAANAFQVTFDQPFVERDCFEHTRPIRVPAETFLSQLV